MSPALDPPVPSQVRGWGRVPVAPLGAALWIAWTDHGLSRVMWALPSAPASADSWLQTAAEVAVPPSYREPIERYLAGEAVDPALLPVDLAGTTFQRKVWQALRAIPRGRVRSYAGIAADVGKPRAMRAVGMANARNPLAIVVPCHRIVANDGSLGGYTPGVELKRWLLALEGVELVGDVVRPGQLSLLANR